MVSKVQQAKDACGYSPTPVLPVCGTCQHFCFDRQAPAWMLKELKKEGVVKIYGHGSFSSAADTPQELMKETNLRCSLHGFAVKKLAGCKSWTQRAGQEQGKS